MSIRIDSIRLVGGSRHEHISHLWWTDSATGATGDDSRAEIVKWIEDKGVSVYVDDAVGHRARVGVRTPHSGEKYLQTQADGVWTDNLLSLPRR